jgi:two-component system, response regulator PdtaR
MRDQAGILVLVVDDYPLVRMYGVEMVAEAGFPTIEASNGDEALRILESRSDVGVLFTDVEMPPTKMTGVHLAEIVNERWPDIRLVVTSGRANLKDDNLPDDGRFIEKPYTPEDVSEVLQAVTHPAT